MQQQHQKHLKGPGGAMQGNMSAMMAAQMVQQGQVPAQLLQQLSPSMLSNTQLMMQAQQQQQQQQQLGQQQLQQQMQMQQTQVILRLGMLPYFLPMLGLGAYSRCMRWCCECLLLLGLLASCHDTSPALLRSVFCLVLACAPGMLLVCSLCAPLCALVCTRVLALCLPLASEVELGSSGHAAQGL